MLRFSESGDDDRDVNERFGGGVHVLPRHRHRSAAAGTVTHTHPFNGPLSRTTRVSRYQKGKVKLHFTEARDRMELPSSIVQNCAKSGGDHRVVN